MGDFNWLEHGNVLTEKFSHFYRGEVIDSEDPKKAQRLKIRIYPMYRNMKDEELPWAIPAVGITEIGTGYDIGGNCPPAKGSWVFCFFEEGNIYQPVWFAMAPAINEDGKPDGPKRIQGEDDEAKQSMSAGRATGVSTASGGTWDEPEDKFDQVYGKDRAIRTPAGLLLEFNDTDGNVKFLLFHPSGSFIEIDNEGNMLYHSAKNQYDVVLEDKNIYVKGNRNQTVDGDLGDRVKGTADIKIDSDYNITVTGTCAIRASTIRLN